MKISSRCEYACKAMIELVLCEHKNIPVTAQHIAARRKIPEKFLVHIMLQLKRAGLVQSIRGSQGGYRLGRSADAITLLDIVTAIDGPVLDIAGNEAGDELEPVWREIAGKIESVFSGVTLQAMLEHVIETNMYYI